MDAGRAIAWMAAVGGDEASDMMDRAAVALNLILEMDARAPLAEFESAAEEAERALQEFAADINRRTGFVDIGLARLLVHSRAAEL